MNIEEARRALQSAIGKAVGSFDKKNGELAYLAMTSKCEHAVRDRIAMELHKNSSSDYLTGREYRLPAKLKKVYLSQAEERWRVVDRVDPSGVGNRLKGGLNSPAGAIGVKGCMDLAVLSSDGNAILLVETKAEYTFDSRFLHKEGKPYFGAGMQRGIELDLLRSRCFAEALDIDPRRCFVLVFVFDATYGGVDGPDEWKRLSPVIAYEARHREHISNRNTCQIGEFIANLATKSEIFGAVNEIELPTGRFEAGNAFGFDVTMDAHLLQLA